MPEEFDYPTEDPFNYFGALDPPEQNSVIAELAASAKHRSSLIHELAEVFPEFIQLPKPVDERGIGYNSPQLTLIDRKSILYMTQFVDPKASRTELTAIFRVSRQRISQIVGAHGGSKADADLFTSFEIPVPSTCAITGESKLTSKPLTTIAQGVALRTR